MWGGLGSNLTNIVASVQKLGAELESQMDAAVGVEPTAASTAITPAQVDATPAASAAAASPANHVSSNGTPPIIEAEGVPPPSSAPAALPAGPAVDNTAKVSIRIPATDATAGRKRIDDINATSPTGTTSTTIKPSSPPSTPTASTAAVTVSGEGNATPSTTATATATPTGKPKKKKATAASGTKSSKKKQAEGATPTAATPTVATPTAATPTATTTTIAPTKPAASPSPSSFPSMPFTAEKPPADQHPATPAPTTIGGQAVITTEQYQNHSSNHRTEEAPVGPVVVAAGTDAGAAMKHAAKTATPAPDADAVTPSVTPAITDATSTPSDKLPSAAAAAAPVSSTHAVSSRRENGPSTTPADVSYTNATLAPTPTPTTIAGGLSDEARAALMGQIDGLEVENTALQANISRSDTYIAELEGRLQVCGEEIATRDSAIAAMKVQLSRGETECGRLAECLTARERSLESAMTQLADVNAQVTSKSARIDALVEEQTAMAAKIKAYAATSGAEPELRRQLAALSEEGREKDRRLESYNHEGQALAKKQGDMEKMVRKSKTDLREKEAEMNKLKEGREQLVKTIEEMQEIIRRHDTDSTTTSKSISAMQAVSQASMDRLARLEAELAGKTEEISTQKRALDSAWSEIAELKRSSAAIRAERDDINKHKGQRDDKLVELESVARDLEQREAVLRATNKQLQDSLQRQMSDASTREERLREEITDARKRWQDAISNRESLANEVGQSTGPLLRQIAGLQESIKNKSEAWQGVESSLLERALRAESVAESSSYKMKTLEEKYQSASKFNEEITSRLHDKENRLQDLQMSAERWARQEKEFADRVADLETRLATESTQRLNAQSAMRELESRARNDAREGKEALDAASKQSQQKIATMDTEIEYLREQLDAYKPQQGQHDMHEQENRGGGGDSSGSGKNNTISKGKSENSLFDPPHSTGGSSSSSNSSSYSNRNSNNSVNNSYLPNGEMSYASANRLSQQLEMKEQDNHSLTLQLQQLQLSRSALLQEVSYLSARNAELEESMGSDSNSAETIARLDKENSVLLILLGEKEEELENVVSDLKDVKHLYKAQLSELYDRIAPMADVVDKGTGSNSIPVRGMDGPVDVTVATAPSTPVIGTSTDKGNSGSGSSTTARGGHERFMTTREKSRLGGSPGL